MNKTIIDVKELKKSYKNQKVLKGVTLKVREGEIFALLGSNGAGKTTTIKILSTLINADSGKATLCGYDSEKNSKQVRENISLTGQFAAVDEVLTGEENLKLIAELRGEKNSFEVANFFLEEFDLKHAKDKKVENYSGGMRRRLDISMSLVGNPKILFLDEPTTGLDPQSRNSMWKIIRSLSSNGTTIFLTTQYLDEAEQLADNIAILNEGKIVAEGTADELKKQIPEGLVELEFSDEEDYLNAKLMLSDFELSKDDKMLTLGIVSDNSFENFLGLLNSFKNKGLNISKITQKQPSLEDVFLHVINSNSIGGNSNE